MSALRRWGQNVAGTRWTRPPRRSAAVQETGHTPQLTLVQPRVRSPAWLPTTTARSWSSPPWMSRVHPPAGRPDAAVPMVGNIEGSRIETGQVSMAPSTPRTSLRRSGSSRPACDERRRAILRCACAFQWRPWARGRPWPRYGFLLPVVTDGPAAGCCLAGDAAHLRAPSDTSPRSCLAP